MEQDEVAQKLEKRRKAAEARDRALNGGGPPRFVMNVTTGVILPMTRPLEARVAKGELAECTLEGDLIPYRPRTMDMVNFMKQRIDLPNPSSDLELPEVELPVPVRPNQDKVKPETTEAEKLAIEAKPAHEPVDMVFAKEGESKDEALERVSKQTDADLAALKESNKQKLEDLTKEV